MGRRFDMVFDMTHMVVMVAYDESVVADGVCGGVCSVGRRSSVIKKRGRQGTMSSLGYAEKLSFRADVGTVGMPELFDSSRDLQSKVLAVELVLVLVDGAWSL